LSAEAPVPEVAGVEELPPAPVRRACVVVLGGQPFAVDVADAREVVELDATTPVPGAPAPLLGVMNLRGSVLPVVEARPLLGLPVRATAEPGRALVVADGAQRAAILIERVLGLATLDAVQPPAAGADHGGFAVGQLAAEPGAGATLLDARAMLAALRRPWDSTPGGTGQT
jgi:purine-binding chemotaxis protein CheW